MDSAPWLQDFLARERLPDAYADEITRVHAPLADDIAVRARAQPGLLVGVCAPQASGKSTLCASLEHLLAQRGLSAVTLALDDLYLPRADRERLAAEVHPLLRTRGVPGTHDVALGERLIEALRSLDEVRLPRFDKATDDRAPDHAGRRVQGPVDVILFEGWCVGARPQPQEALAEPANALEAEEDSTGAWRRYVQAALAGPYRALFSRIDRLVLLRPPGFEVVLGWRREQERKLRERLASEGAPAARAMSDEAVARFIAHYERLTRWILAEMPARADVLVDLDLHRSGTLARL